MRLEATTWARGQGVTLGIACGQKLPFIDGFKVSRGTHLDAAVLDLQTAKTLLGTRKISSGQIVVVVSIAELKGALWQSSVSSFLCQSSS